MLFSNLWAGGSSPAVERGLVDISAGSGFTIKPVLEEAVPKMAKGQLGRDLQHTQVVSIEAFLRTLTGDFRGRKVTAPVQVTATPP
jgi:hypothetical protein